MSLACDNKHARSNSRLHLVVDASAQPLPVECRGISPALILDFQCLFRQLGIDADLQPDTTDLPTADRQEGAGFRLAAADAAALGSLAGTGIRLYPARGLPGIFAGQSTHLRSLIVGIPESAPEDAIVACASRLDNPAPTLIVDRPDVHRLLSAGDTAQPLVECDAAAAMKALIRGEAGALMVPTRLVAAYAAAAITISGSEPLAIQVVGASTGLAFSQVANGAEQAEPAALCLAAVWLLLALKKNAAAERLHNALLKCLDDGLHTPSLPLVTPYSRRVNAREMMDAIGDRLGMEPRGMLPVRYSDAARPETPVQLACVN